MRYITYVVLTFILCGCGDKSNQRWVDVNEVAKANPDDLICQIVINSDTFVVDSSSCDRAIKLIKHLQQVELPKYHFNSTSLVDSNKDIVIYINRDSNKERYLYFKYYEDLNVFSINCDSRKASEGVSLQIECFFDDIVKKGNRNRTKN